MIKSPELFQQKQKLANFLQTDPDNPQLVNQLINICMQLGEHEEALVYVESLLILSDDSTSALFTKSNILLALAKAQEAVEVLESIETSTETKQSVAINLSHAYFQLGEFEKANQLLATLKEFPSSSVYILQARLYHHTGELTKGVDLLRKALSLYPEDSDIKGLLSILLLDSGIYTKETLDLAESALTSKPTQIDSLLTAGMMQQHYVKDLINAEKYFDIVIKEHPNVGRGWLYKGMALMLKKMLKEAQPYLKKACELMGEHIGSWHALGWNYILLEQISDAQLCFDTAMQLDRNFAETHGGISVIQAMNGDKTEAKKTAKLALRLNSQCFSAQYTLLILEKSKGNPEKAKEVLQQVFATEQGKEAQEFIKILQNTTNK